MELLARKVGDYLDVKVKLSDAVIDLGLLDKDECLILARQFEAATDRLTSFTNK